ncbi:MAG TPA: M3 family metallopeptidase [Opitutales bacterium]|nr:M3 family metallopeptidase [Opitutales bacterium]
MSHPFLDNDFQIRWSQLQPERIVPDIEVALVRAQEKIDALTELDLATLSFENTMLALENATEELSDAWGKVSHLTSVNDSKPLREAYNEMLPKVSAFFTKVPLNEKLWNVVKAYEQTDEAAQLTGARRRFLEETVKDFRQYGADLPADQKSRLEEIESELAQITQKFSENVLDSTNDWELVIENEEDLIGLPENAKEAARQSALAKGYGTEEEPKWRFTLHMPSMEPFMTYLENDALRREMWEGATSIGAKGDWDNSGLVKRILALRDEKARLLGKENFADFVLERRMAESGQGALRFVEDLFERSKKAFDTETAELEAFKAKETQSEPEPLEPWEIGFWSEKQRKALFDFDEEELRPYFPIKRVIDGMFEIVERIFEVRIVEKETVFLEPGKAEDSGNGKVEVWHPEVKFYDLVDRDNRHLGSFYSDWHPRESKRGGAWMNSLLTGEPAKAESAPREPHLGLICGNLTPPVGEKPALLTHREVETIFHEFGHLLHHLLGEVEIKSLNGVSVPWDFVELPSQIMENWCWERESLDLFARHHETGAAIPEELFQKMTAARHYRAASAMMRQLSFAKLDLELHFHYKKFEGKDLEVEVRNLIEDYMPRTKTESPTIVRRFSHLFGSSTGYAAGYYSYKWAEVLDTDAFTRFQKEGLFSPIVGREFVEKILSRGNSEEPAVLYRDFMGRDPDLNALLERSGLVKKSG